MSRITIHIEHYSRGLIMGVILLLSLINQVALAQQLTAQEVEAKVDNLLKEMTLEEKLLYIGGYNDFYIRPIPRLGIPAIRMADGPIGVRNAGKSTQYPACIALAASWNDELARAYGESLGRDSRARGVHILLAPGMNIYRNPLCGRNFEYTGEDPVLAARMGYGLITGIQSQGVLATAKHFAANNQDYRRFDSNSVIDERTMHEIYFPAFKSAVQKAKAACVMCAYNLLNGDWCSANKYLNIDILKEMWGFDGVLMSDWGAVHEITAVANNGLDIEMPGGKYLNPDNLAIMVRAGKVKQATIDDKVRRLLRVIVRAGFLTQEQKLDYPLDDPKCAAVALDVAREGIVLLRNENNTLPLNTSNAKKIVVVGPMGGHIAAGGGSSKVEPFHEVNTVDGIKSILGDNGEVKYFPIIGRMVSNEIAKSSVFGHTDDSGEIKPGIKVEYFNGIGLAGEPVLTRIENIINKMSPAAFSVEGITGGEVSVRWTGMITPKTAGEYSLTACCDDGMRVWFDDELIVNEWSDHAAMVVQKQKTLEAGKSYNIKIEYYQKTGDAVAQFGWGMPKNSLSDAVAAAKEADAAVVCVGFGSDSEGEGSDRSFTLPAGQEDLIKAIAAANDRTIVIINAGGNVDMQNWLADVPALLMAWYPGQEGGQALAEIIFGKVNPSGKLPATFEKKWEDNPSYKNYGLTNGHDIEYKEGIFVGYRGFEKQNIEPQFPFGYGLSYTNFKYGKPTVTVERENDLPVISVKFTIENTGEFAGSETAQVYLSWLDARLPQPVKALKGFQKVALQPGESKEVNITLSTEALASFDPEIHNWIIDGKKFEILIGSSSADIRGKAAFTLK